jgi:hypothetical protein
MRREGKKGEENRRDERLVEMKRRDEKGRD